MTWQDLFEVYRPIRADVRAMEEARLTNRAHVAKGFRNLTEGLEDDTCG